MDAKMKTALLNANTATGRVHTDEDTLKALRDAKLVAEKGLTRAGRNARTRLVDAELDARF